jgi:hypothetical protein
VLIYGVGALGVRYSQRHSVINHCDRRITLLSDTDISFGLFNLRMPFKVLSDYFVKNGWATNSKQTIYNCS